MFGSMALIVRQFKQRWTEQLTDEAVEQACHEAGHCWRDTLLNPVTTLRLFFVQILHGNTACAHLPHLTKLRFTASAYCEARMRLPLAVWQTLLWRTTSQCNQLLDHAARW